MEMTKRNLEKQMGLYRRIFSDLGKVIGFTQDQMNEIVWLLKDGETYVLRELKKLSS